MNSPPTFSRRRRPIRILFAFLPFVALALAELVVRGTNLGMPTEAQMRSLNPVGLPMFECASAGPGLRVCQTSRWYRGVMGSKKFSLPKPAGKVRIFVLGESVAAGYPFFQPGSFAQFMSLALADSRPGVEYEVINAGVQGVRSLDVLEICREVVKLEPDWIVIYLGNNEFLGLDPEKERGWKADLRDALRRRLLSSRLYYAALSRLQLRSADVGKTPDPLRSAVESHDEAGRRNWDQAARADVTRRFERNLKAMIDLAENRGVHVVLATVAVNLRSFFPFRDDEKWPGADGCQAPLAGATVPLAPAAQAERDDCARDPGRGPSADAVEDYRRACCALWREDRDAARKDFLSAVERDRLQLRATPTINGIIRRNADRRALPLADVESVFASASAFGIPGDDLFLDHVHPDLTGADLLARAIIPVLGPASGTGENEEARLQMRRRADEYIRSVPASFLYSSYLTDAGHVLRFGCFTRSARLYRKAVSVDPSRPEALDSARQVEGWSRLSATELNYRLK